MHEMHEISRISSRSRTEQDGNYRPVIAKKKELYEGDEIRSCRKTKENDG